MQREISCCRVRKGWRTGDATPRSGAVAKVGGAGGAGARIADGRRDGLKDVVLDVGGGDARAADFDTN